MPLKDHGELCVTKPPGEREEAAARRQVAAHARTPDDCRMLLAVLGLDTAR
ncbi:hypothetical protein H9Y04_40650 [Streptomyces sp. TRM66268-LWL]|uniref:Uncharacterized protein n=1 Tax=Streptomyces polyasparticus TaxID=2767826 RepID=A0ABR7SW94_9ACTN|nr:hypothetical protein [Streptomyces polyasparticus]MBC9718857.1 hypothetical protein [Streptomyces polyasparticus]